MRAPLRLTLALAVFLFAGGIVVAPHVDPPNKPHLHIDHVPTALRLAVLTRFGHLFTNDGPAFVSPPEMATLTTAVLALLAFRWPKPRHPDRLGIVIPVVALGGPQPRRATAHGPPRTSLPY